MSKKEIYFLEEVISSLMSTFKTLAISSNVSKDGCISLVHHREIVALLFPNLSASQLLDRFFSAKTTLNEKL
jgi:hypothetical protein